MKVRNRWFKEPDFLQSAWECWPKEGRPVEDVSEDMESNTVVVLAASTEKQLVSGFNHLWDIFSGWDKLIKSVVWLWRFLAWKFPQLGISIHL